MQKFTSLLIVAVFLTSCSHTYYIARHAEKAVPSAGNTMSTPDDPPLSDAGTRRAETIREVLKDKNIRHIYSTNTKRTRLTAEPLSKAAGIEIQTYGPRPDSTFILILKKTKKNTLIIGHSNTVDELVNGLTNEKNLSDLADSEYDNLFIVHYKRLFGMKIKYERKKY
ncbi:MAG: histidine phosphatase family protein [Chitinophagaceae bacterium]|nr:histidine phosphatase family protein [Chitinophagaceae bacterium]